jgi:hypothetical protein
MPNSRSMKQKALSGDKYPRKKRSAKKKSTRSYGVRG